MKQERIWGWLTTTSIVGSIAFFLGVLLFQGLSDVARGVPQDFTWIAWPQFWGVCFVSGTLLGTCTEVMMRVMWCRRAGVVFGLLSAPLLPVVLALIVSGDSSTRALVVWLGMSFTAWAAYWLLKLALQRGLGLEW